MSDRGIILYFIKKYSCNKQDQREQTVAINNSFISCLAFIFVTSLFYFILIIKKSTTIALYARLLMSKYAAI